MSFIVTYQVEGNPVGKGRPKFARRGNFVSTYTPTKTRDYESLIKQAAFKAMGNSAPLETPMSVAIYITVKTSSSFSKKTRQEAINGLIKPTKKPDADNIAKCFLDAMNGVVYKDDSQVCTLHIKKVYGDIGMVEVMVQEDLE
jgi:Holliday junction resolvase RusA-like endonuclease